MKPATINSAAALLLALVPLAAPADSTERPRIPAAVRAGYELYVNTGCFQCHGFVGQGSIQTGGTRLAPDPIPLDAFRAYLRAPAGRMPPYSRAVISDQQIDEIYRYVKSIAATPGPQRIPLLNELLSATGGDVRVAITPEQRARGAEAFANNCAACHGAEGAGGVARELRSETSKRALGGTVRLLKEPPRGMPKLFPAPLSEADVEAVALYVRQLKK